MPKAGQVRLITTVVEAKAGAKWLADYLKIMSRMTILGGPQGLTPQTLKLVELVNLLEIKSAKRRGNCGFVVVIDRKLLSEVQFLHLQMQAMQKWQLIGIISPLERFARSVHLALAGRGRLARSKWEKAMEAQLLRKRIARNERSISDGRLKGESVDFLIARNDAMRRNIRRLDRAIAKPEFPEFKKTVLTGSCCAN